MIINYTQIRTCSYEDYVWTTSVDWMKGVLKLCYRKRITNLYIEKLVYT